MYVCMYVGTSPGALQLESSVAIPINVSAATPQMHSRAGQKHKATVHTVHTYVNTTTTIHTVRTVRTYEHIHTYCPLNAYYNSI